MDNNAIWICFAVLSLVQGPQIKLPTKAPGHVSLCLILSAWDTLPYKAFKLALQVNILKHFQGYPLLSRRPKLITMMIL